LDVLNRGWRVWGENPSRGKPLTLADVDGCMPTAEGRTVVRCTAFNPW